MKKLWKSRLKFAIIQIERRRSQGVMFDIWKNILAEVEQSIPREQFSTWFTGTELISIENNVATIGVPNVFKRTQLQSKYSTVIKDAFEHNNISIKNLHYDIITKDKAKSHSSHRSGSAQIQSVTNVASSNYRSISSTNSSLQTGLNPRYTLDNFVIGTNNDLAVSVARNVIDHPGTRYNPFFLYGGPGLGKTHLVQAIGNEILKRDPKLRVLYTPISSFYSDFIKSLQNKKSDEFRQKFRKLDILIIDDFQMIMNKDASQAEFFDIFNELTMNNKQVIVTSDRLPDQIKSVDERLASRLSQSGEFDLQMPQFEDRCAILRSMAEFRGAEIEDEAIEYIADNVKTNIRALEGELNHILAVADFKGMTPLEVINEGYVNTTNSPRTKTVSPKQVVERVAKYYQLTTKEMCGKSRVAHIKNARQVAMYILSKDLGMSTPKIALEVGVKDHTTVMHGIKKIDGDLKLNFNLRDQISEIKEKLYG